MKHLILTFLTVIAVTTAKAQTIEDYRANLNVREVGSAANVIAGYDAQRNPTTIDGYRVQIFSDSKQNARASAQAIQSQFDALYPTTPSYFTWDSPNFIVMVGDFTTKEEAMALMGHILGTFPRAVLVHQSIPVKVFGLK